MLSSAGICMETNCQLWYTLKSKIWDAFTEAAGTCRSQWQADKPSGTVFWVTDCIKCSRHKGSCSYCATLMSSRAVPQLFLRALVAVPTAEVFEQRAHQGICHETKASPKIHVGHSVPRQKKHSEQVVKWCKFESGGVNSKTRSSVHSKVIFKLVCSFAMCAQMTVPMCNSNVSRQTECQCLSYVAEHAHYKKRDTSKTWCEQSAESGSKKPKQQKLLQMLTWQQRILWYASTRHLKFHSQFYEMSLTQVVKVWQAC